MLSKGTMVAERRRARRVADPSLDPIKTPRTSRAPVAWRDRHARKIGAGLLGVILVAGVTEFAWPGDDLLVVLRTALFLFAGGVAVWLLGREIARLREAESALADRNNVYAGVRNEEVAASRSEVGKAQSRLAYAEQQLGRFARLTRDNFASRQALNQTEMQVASARADVAEAAANYAAAKAGPTRQERPFADARVSAAAETQPVRSTRSRSASIGSAALLCCCCA
jgi:hypothetical protein